MHFEKKVPVNRTRKRYFVRETIKIRFDVGVDVTCNGHYGKQAPTDVNIIIVSFLA